MARTLLQQYLDIPDGTECHRKTYASTAVSGAAGERRPAPRAQGAGRWPEVGAGPSGAARVAG